MSRLPIAATLGALLLGLPATATAQGTAASPKEAGSPIGDQGSNYNYRSEVTRVSPAVPGLSLEVLEFADRLVMRNHTGKTVTVLGYEGEQYARVRPDGAVEVNTNSPAYYLNENFYANVKVPPTATPTATPHWSVVDRIGELEWHDHRIHWMSPAIPPEVKNKSKLTKIFNWQVPIKVGSAPAMINGQLFWVPEEGTRTPPWAVIALVLISLSGGLFVLIVRRGRSRRPQAPKGSPSPTVPGGRGDAAAASREEAW